MSVNRWNYDPETLECQQVWTLAAQLLCCCARADIYIGHNDHDFMSVSGQLLGIAQLTFPFSNNLFYVCYRV